MNDMIFNPEFRHENLRHRLKLIASLRTGETLSTITENKIKRESWYCTYQRYLYNEDRLKTMAWIENYIEKGVRLLNEDLDIQEYIELKDLLGGASEGLDHLYLTYYDDASMQSRIRSLQTQIEQKIKPTQKADILYRHIHSLSSPNLLHLEKLGEKEKCQSQSFPNSSISDVMLFHDEKEEEHDEDQID